jgi:hypothetical protein
LAQLTIFSFPLQHGFQPVRWNRVLLAKQGWFHRNVERKKNMGSTRSTTQERVAIRKLIWVGPLTIILAVVVNLVVRACAVSIFGVSSSFPYLQPSVIIITTVVFLLIALIAFLLTGRMSSHPVRSFWIVGGIALLVSFMNPILQLAGHWLPATGMNLPIFWTMIVMHCASALITISLLTTLAVERVPMRRDRNEADVGEANENQETRRSQPSRH